ncbi:MAG: family 78 glycoside hydrolase catalytic domain [Verrucomicrobia bacterium]|nr:family 78 glycoside hydrolase catalytic domain [Verrucomicrobiota bacterium]MCH8514659.1 glycoside hydrolase family 78 protein [Kiritimatiellia bacterium]
MKTENNHPIHRATWIQAPWSGGPRESCPAPLLRRAFSLPDRPQRATLHLSALGLVQATLNGQAVSEDIFLPGWTDYRKKVRWISLDVTHLLQAGPNVLGAVLGDGWYCGHVANGDRQVYGDRPRLLIALEWTHVDGTQDLLFSDESWTCRPGPILANDLLMGESCDARKAPQGWDLPGADASPDWTSVETHHPAGMKLIPWIGTTVRRQEHLAPVAQSTCPKTGATLYDLGQNIAGRVRIRVQGPAGATLRLRHAEMLTPDGSMYLENLRGARAEDHYTLRGGEPETWEPAFTFHGFRHVEVYWLPDAPAGKVLDLEGIVLHSDIPRTGDFTCSHPLLNQLYQNTLWGQKGNFLEVPTDCPQRDERLGWTGDAQAFVRTAALNMDVADFFRKWLADMRDAQYPDGAIPAVIPNTESFGVTGDAGPAWADAALICPWELYRAYGDPAFLEDHLDCMTRYMQYLAAHKVKDGVRGHPDVTPWGGFGDWLALDGSGKTEGGTPKEYIGTAFYARNAWILARTHEHLGLPEAALTWQTLFSDTRKHFQKAFLRSEGFPIPPTQTACVLALHFDLLEPEQRRATGKQLVELIHDNNDRIGTGFVGTPYILHVLEAIGETQLAYTLLEQEAFPSWLFPVKNGATTIWERWDGWTPESGFQDKHMNSFNHYAYGAVCDWMIGSVAGIEPCKPGYAAIRFKPRPGGSLQHASASLQTPQGKAAIAWRIENQRLILDLTWPENVPAELDLPPEWRTKNPWNPLAGRQTVKCVSP